MVLLSGKDDMYLIWLDLKIPPALKFSVTHTHNSNAPSQSFSQSESQVLSAVGEHSCFKGLDPALDRRASSASMPK